MNEIDPQIRLLLRASDQAFSSRSWHGTTLRGALRGVALPMARWQPSTTRKSIWEYVLHASYWKFVARRAIEGFTGNTFERKPGNWPRVPEDPTLADWKRDIKYLEREHALLRTTLGNTPADALYRPIPGKTQGLVVDFALGITAHDLYHSGQIQLLKRLFREAHPQARGV